MNPINNILVIVDPTAELQPAVAKAAVLATNLGARLELYVCDTKAARESRLAAHIGRDSNTSGLMNLKSFLEGLAEPLRERGLDVETETDFGASYCERLMEKTKRTTADLVVKDTHHHSLPRRTFLTITHEPGIDHGEGLIPNLDAGQRPCRRNPPAQPVWKLPRSRHQRTRDLFSRVRVQFLLP